MITKNLLPSLLLLVILSSCSNDMDTNDFKKLRLVDYNGIELVYDQQGRLTQYGQQIYVFDEESRLLRRESTEADWYIELSYDAIDRVDRISGPPNFMTSEGRTINYTSRYTYDNDGKIRSVRDREINSDPNRSNFIVDKSYEYNAKNQLIRIIETRENEDRDDSKARFTIEYDDRGNVSSETIELLSIHSGTWYNYQTETYEYDEMKNPFWGLYNHVREEYPYDNYNMMFDIPGSVYLTYYPINAINFLSKNNIVTRETTLYGANGSVSRQTTRRTEYAYNEQGYPITSFTERFSPQVPDEISSSDATFTYAEF